MKSNIMKMVTICMCMMVVGFAADGEKVVKTLKHKVSNNIQEKMDVMKSSIITKRILQKKLWKSLVEKVCQ